MREYSLIRSKRRTLSLEIRELEVVVRSPLGLSKKAVDAFVESREKWIEEHLELQRRKMEAHPEPDEAERERLIALAKEILPAKTAHFAAIMGVFPTSVSITGAKKRFGSCSSRGRICYSWRLMMYPEAAIDYVVVHELAHLLHMDHSRDFYKCVEAMLPDYKARQRMLKE